MGKLLKQVLMCLLVVSLAGSCASSNHTSHRQETANEISPTKENISYLNLGEYLKRVPGVHVQQVGDNYIVNIRSNFRLSGSTEPLFVVNSVPLNGYHQAAALVNPMEIDKVRVIKDVATTSIYGLRGANGVIVIYLKQ